MEYDKLMGRSFIKTLPGQAVFSVLINGLIFGSSILRVYFFSKALSVEDFGILSLLLTISGFGTYLFSIGSFQYVFKNAASSEKKYDAFRTAIVLTIIMSSAMLLFYVVLQEAILKRYHLELYRQSMLLNFSSTFLMTILMHISFLRQGEMDNNRYNIIQFLRQVPWILASIVLFFVAGKIDIEVIFIIINISLLISISLSLRREDLKSLFRWRSLSFSELFSYSLPLLPYYLGLWGIPMILRSSIGASLGYASLAVFSVSYTMIDIVFLFVSAISSTLTPYFFHQSDDFGEKYQYNRMLRVSCIGTLFALFAVMVFGDVMVLFLTSEKYKSAIGLLYILFPIAVIKIVSLNFEQLLLKKSMTRELGFVYLVSILATFFVSKIAIPEWGIAGALVSSFVPQLVIFLILFLYQRGMLDASLIRRSALIQCAFCFFVTGYIAINYVSGFWLRAAIFLGSTLFCAGGLGLWEKKEKKFVSDLFVKFRYRSGKI